MDCQLLLGNNKSLRTSIDSHDEGRSAKGHTRLLQVFGLASGLVLLIEQKYLMTEPPNKLTDLPEEKLALILASICGG